MTSILRMRTTLTGVTGSPYVSTQYFTGSTNADAANAASAVGAFFNSIKTRWPNALAYNVEPFVDVINDATGALTAVVNIGGGVSGVGSSGQVALPWATQGLLRFNTGTVVGGRLLRGRMFVPGPTEADSDVGVPLAAYITALNTAYTALTTALPNTLRVWSRTHGTSALVTGASPWSQWAVMRSRRD
jgi:hypothetical protein